MNTSPLLLSFCLTILLIPIGCSRSQRFTYATPDNITNHKHTKYWIYIGTDRDYSYLKRIDYELTDRNDPLYQSIIYKYYNETGYIISNRYLTTPADVKPGDQILLKDNCSFEFDENKPKDDETYNLWLNQKPLQ